MLAVDLRPDVHSLRGPLDDDNVSAKFMVNASITPSFPFKCLAAEAMKDDAHPNQES